MTPEEVETEIRALSTVDKLILAVGFLKASEAPRLARELVRIALKDLEKAVGPSQPGVSL